MKEIRTIVRAYNSIDFTQTRAALATVVRVEGSSYRRAGARMLVLDDGTYLGGISGGCLEGDALRRAQKGIMLGRSSVITYDTTQDDDYQIGVGLGCEGVIDVLFTPLRPEDAANPLGILAGLTEIRQPEILLTVTGAPDLDLLGRTVKSPSTAGIGKEELERTFEALVPFGPGGMLGELEADIRQCLLDKTSRSVKYGEIRIFIEVVLPAIHLVAYGGNYDIRTLLQQSKELGWDSTIVLNTSRADRGLIGSATRVWTTRSLVFRLSTLIRLCCLCLMTIVPICSISEECYRLRPLISVCWDRANGLIRSLTRCRTRGILLAKVIVTVYMPRRVSILALPLRRRLRFPYLRRCEVIFPVGMGCL